MNRFASTSLRKALADITRRKGRTLLVVLGIFIGVFGLTAITITQDQLFAAFAFSVGSQATQPDLIVDINRSDPRLKAALLSIPNIRRVQEETTLSTQWHVSRAPGHADFTIISYPDLQHPAVTPFELVSGRYPGAGEIVMEYGDTAIQPVAIGDLITVDTAHGSATLRVVGLARTPGVNPATTDSARGYMNESALQSLPAFTDVITAPVLGPLRISHLAIKLVAITQASATAQAIGPLLHTYGVSVLGVSFPTPIVAQLRQLDGLFTLLRILALLAVVTSALFLLNTVTTLIAEQMAIIGTMKAIGGTRRAILSSYLLSIGLYSLLATVPGLALGIVGGAELAALLAQRIPLAPSPLVVTPDIIALSLAVGFGIPLCASLWPLWNGTRITVREALAAYGIDKGQQSNLLARFGRHLTWISQTIWLGLRSLFRKRTSAVLTILMLTIAGAGFLIVQTAASSVNTTIGSSWTHIHADVEVYADEPYSQARSQLATLPGVRHLERFGTSGAETAWGKLGLWGFEPQTQIYHYQLTSGRWLREGDTNVVLISDAVAEQTGLHAGSRLVVTNLAGNASTNWTVIGTVNEAVDSLGQIGTAVVPVDTLYRFEGVPAASVSDYTNKLLIQSKDPTSAGIDRLANQVDTLGTNLVLSGSAGRGAGPGPVFLVQDEALRHQRAFYVLYAILYAVALLTGVAGMLGLGSTLAASVVERQREIGLVRAMGASSWRVGQVFWTEGLTLGSIAWCLSALLGLPLASAFLQIFSHLVIPVNFVVDPLAFLIMVAALFLIVTMASIIPTRRASRLRIADLLRYE